MPLSACLPGYISCSSKAGFCQTVPELINPVSCLCFSYSALSSWIWLGEKSNWVQLYPGSRRVPNSCFCDHGTELNLHRFQKHSTAVKFYSIYLDSDQWLKLQFLFCFRCSCWIFSQGSSFLSLQIDGWPGTRLRGKYPWSFLFYIRVSLFFQVSTIPH